MLKTSHEQIIDTNKLLKSEITELRRRESEEGEIWEREIRLLAEKLNRMEGRNLGGSGLSTGIYASPHRENLGGHFESLGDYRHRERDKQAYSDKSKPRGRAITGEFAGFDKYLAEIKKV